MANPAYFPKKRFCPRPPQSPPLLYPTPPVFGPKGEVLRPVGPGALQYPRADGAVQRDPGPAGQRPGG